MLLLANFTTEKKRETNEEFSQEVAREDPKIKERQNTVVTRPKTGKNQERKAKVHKH